MEDKCLICNELFPVGGGQQQSKSKKSRPTSTENIQLISDSKTKFALTNSQYVILQKVLSLPVDLCKSELTNGPYCRECFTHINNVCHIMSALENLQESVQEFRKDFGAKLKSSFDAAAGTSAHGTRGKRKVTFPADEDNYSSTRQIILDCLKNSLRFTAFPSSTAEPDKKKPKHLHEIIKKMDPEGAPNTKVSADMVVRTTNGDMPPLPLARNLKKGQQQQHQQKVIIKSPVKPSGQVWTGTKKYPCPYCKLRFYKGTSLKEHLKLIHPDQGDEEEEEEAKYICWYCKSPFDTDEELKEHEAEHKADNVCPICLKQFNRTSTLNRHILTHAKKEKKVNTKLTCDICSKSFSNKKLLKSHKSKAHRKEKLIVKFTPRRNIGPATTKTFRPGRCKICVRIVTDLEGHMNTTHPGIRTNKINGTNNNKISNDNDDDDDFSAPTSTTSDDIVKVKVPKAARAGPASSKLKAVAPPSSVQDEDSNPPPTLIAEGRLTTNEETKSEERRELNDSEETKTEDNKEKEEKTDQKEKSLSVSPSPPPRKKITENNYLAAVSKMIVPPPPSSSQQSGSSKYQFKNLLKLETKE